MTWDNVVAWAAARTWGSVVEWLTLLATAAIPIALYVWQNTAAKKQATMEMLKEFNSQEMAASRKAARTHIMAIELLHGVGRPAASNNPTGATSEDLDRLARFYHRLNVLRKEKLVAKHNLFNLFAMEFAFWWEFSFKAKAADDDFRTGPDLAELYSFFRTKAMWTRKSKAWRGWLAVAAKELAGAATAGATIIR